MHYCHERGIPHSHFLGGPMRWTAEDRAKVVAFGLEKAERCTMCGTADWEWDEDRFAYGAEMQVCRGCQLKDNHRNTTENPPPGSSVVLVPKAVHQRHLEQEHERESLSR